jgi:predicted phage terminase large subunit-like protein
MIERIREVQREPDGYLDLWGRDHRKSTVITFGKTLQDILASHGEDPLPEWGGREATFGIFSHTRPIAKAFLRQIKHEAENNIELRELFPDVLWEKPDRDAPNWSEDTGLVFRRQSNPKEATVEAWGVVDGQPTGKHFLRLVDDDIVTLASVNSPEMIQKTTEAWSVHLNLGETESRLRVIGTRYHFNDSYREMIARGAVKERRRPATHDGTLTGRPVFLTPEQFAKKVRDMGPYVASAQLLLNPVQDSKQGFRREWLRYYDEVGNWRQMNRALLCDPANEKKRTSDYTSMAVIGLGPDDNYYLLDFLRDRLNLAERADALITMHRKWKPQKVGYEKYGKDADIQAIQMIQTRENYRFDIEEVGGSLSKLDRVNRLIPPVSEGRLYLPRSLMRTLYDGKTVDLIHTLVEEEMIPWPVPVHDDGLDAISRIFDIQINWPKPAEGAATDRYSKKRPSGTWMSAV